MILVWCTAERLRGEQKVGSVKRQGHSLRSHMVATASRWHEFSDGNGKPAIPLESALHLTVGSDTRKACAAGRPVRRRRIRDAVRSKRSEGDGDSVYRTDGRRKEVGCHCAVLSGQDRKSSAVKCSEQSGADEQGHVRYQP